MQDHASIPADGVSYLAALSAGIAPRFCSISGLDVVCEEIHMLLDLNGFEIFLS